MRESDARKDGGTYGEHTTQYSEDRYQDEPEGKREDQPYAAPRTDADYKRATAAMHARSRAQAAPAHTPKVDGLAHTRQILRETTRQLDEAKRAGEALAEALRECVTSEGAACFGDMDNHPEWMQRRLYAISDTARAALAQWEEAKKAD